MQHFNLEKVCQAAITGCYFYPNTRCGIILNAVKDYPLVMDLISRLENEIPEWLRVGHDRKNQKQIEYNNGSKILLFNNQSSVKGITFSIVFVDSRVMTQDLVEHILPCIASHSNHLERLITFVNV